jgi:hypothetical protein
MCVAERAKLRKGHSPLSGALAAEPCVEVANPACRWGKVH